ncbi:B3 domain-containing protein, partial [Trifolium medium]|nr:B3 domain-containing protein [Trifolium medium]
MQYLPPKLNHIMSNLIDKKINLEDSAGGRTAVTISEVDGSFAFKEGWDVFSKEHGLEIGDIVVFNCINKLNFDVKIYDESVCERLDFSKKRNGRKRDRSGHIYQNDDLAVFNEDPMLEEVLGTGDTSYAS